MLSQVTRRCASTTRTGHPRASETPFCNPCPELSSRISQGFVPRTLSRPIENVSMSHLSQNSSLSGIRPFHSSACASVPTSYNQDHIVPDFYVKHKLERQLAAQASSATPSTTSPRATDTSSTGVDEAAAAAHDPARQTKAVKNRQQEESALMQRLSDSILSDELTASMKRLITKIPQESYNEDGMLVHPSGFMVPGPDSKSHPSAGDVPRKKERERDEEREMAMQTASVAERVLESELDAMHASGAATRSRRNKVPFEVRESDGVVKHPSGFIPPTPADQFKYSDSASLEGDVSTLVARQKTRDAVAAKKDHGVKSMHTASVTRAPETTSADPSP